MFVFRGYEKTTCKMLSHIQLMSIQYPKNYVPSDDTRFDIFNYDKIDIMQRTPYYDVNGIEIFEGDIIETPESKKQRFCYEITIDNETGNFMALPFMKGRANIKFGYSTIQNNQDLNMIMQSDVTVIGNVYENPELLRRY